MGQSHLEDCSLRYCGAGSRIRKPLVRSCLCECEHGIVECVCGGGVGEAIITLTLDMCAEAFQAAG